ncbi:MAG: MBL fold metallo-hydrolase [Alphaproteobacteria bacterium]|jgi:glyoxylase-like metal-dependent hydrolase (beta-lactamase superfamily II)|nr:MBL fold metallo-hydrolase [Alphaproteobacteria bacterium]
MKLNYNVEVIAFDGNLNDIKIHQFSSRSNYFVNSIIIETSKSLILFDTQDESYAELLLAYIKGLNKPLSRVIISHPHIDHYGGLPVFKDIPSYTTIEILKDFAIKNLDNKYIPKFAIEPNFEIDNLNFTVLNMVDTHCPNHLVMWIKELSCVLVADLAQYNGHLLAYDYNGFIKALETIAELSQGYTTLLSGHGKITTTATLQENINYLKECQKIYLTAINEEDFDKKLREKFPNRSRIRVSLGLLLKNKSFIYKG